MQLAMPDANKKQIMGTSLIGTFNNRRDWILVGSPSILYIRQTYPRLLHYDGSMLTILIFILSLLFLIDFLNTRIQSDFLLSWGTRVFVISKASITS